MTVTRFLPLALVGLCSLGGIRTSSAESSYSEGISGWYEAGAAVVEPAKIRDFFGEPVSGNSVRFDTGFHFGIAIGGELSRFVKIEVETGYNYNALNSIDGASASSGNLHRIPILGNLVLQFPNQTRFVPVIGAGVGAQWALFNAQNVVLGATRLDDDSETWVFSYQGYAGIRYRFREDMSLGLFYHYSVADGPSWKFDNIPGGNFKLDAIRTHSLSLTLGWDF